MLKDLDLLYLDLDSISAIASYRLNKKLQLLQQPIPQSVQLGQFGRCRHPDVFPFQIQDPVGMRMELLMHLVDHLKACRVTAPCRCLTIQP